MELSLMSLEWENVAKRFTTLITGILSLCSPALVYLHVSVEISLDKIKPNS
jgi:hypothetical protein